MLFRRKPRNRRLGREQVLEVKLRSSQVRAGRIRFGTLAVATVMGVLFGSYLLWRSGDWLLRRLVYENSAFAVQDLDVQTDGVIAISQLYQWGGLRPRQNLFALDLARVRRNLELVPLIRRASVERILPRTLRVRVIEREPIAQVNLLRQRPGGLESTSFQLDADGYVMLPLESRQRAPQTGNQDPLPVVFGIDPRDLQPGHCIRAAQTQAALQLIVAFQQSPMVGLVDLKSIDLSAPDVLVVKTGQVSDVTFGLTDLEQQLRRWREIFDLGQKLGKAIAALDLAVTNSVPVRWQDPSAVPPGTPKIPKPFRVKKNHV